MAALQVQDYLNSLNAAQRRAVEHDPRIPLQILAGPGSGKTKVLTSRIAHLITVHSLPPRSICAVTFTKKAANEMRERLEKLIGKEKTSQVRMGTFHALCSLYIRKYAVHVGIKGNFTVCDTDEGKKIITALLKPRKEFLKEKEIDLSPANIQSKISSFKAKCVTAADLLAMYPDMWHPAETDKVKILDRLLAELYREYEDTLRANNSLDFDDLLLVGLSLFKNHPPAVTWCKHILVDEFQDTNFTQYGLMRALAVVKCVTIVGDPDQSIYGWRAAEIANLSKMQKDFPGTQQILLEENYRSTASILKCSLAIVSQDKKRIPKSLHTSHPNGITPILRTCETEVNEAAFIAMEIKRVIAHMGGTLRWGDFVILLRFNALSRSIESALQKEGVPSRILGGHKFFDRMEIKDILSYLQLVDNPKFAPAFSRSVNVPARGIGEKTLIEIFAKSDELGISALELVEKIHDSKIPDIKPAIKRKLSPFVTAIRKLRTQANNGTMPSDLIRALLKFVSYEEHLRKTQPDWDVRWENVRELITFATDVQGSMQEANLPDADDENDDTPLRMFLQASMLSSDGDSGTEEDNKDKVTISTCHAAKGLEWPVVIVPSVEDGTFPFHRAEDVDEERRLLYVACTRAKGLLYLTRCLKRTIAGNLMDRKTSQFVSHVEQIDETIITKESLCVFTEPQRATMCAVLQRPLPAAADVAAKVDAFYANIRNRQPFRNLSTGLPDFQPTPGVRRDPLQEINIPPAVGFISVRDMDIKRNVLEEDRKPKVEMDVKPDIKKEKGKQRKLKLEAESDVKPAWSKLLGAAPTKTKTTPSGIENLPDVKPYNAVASSSKLRPVKVKKERSVLDLTISSSPEPEVMMVRDVKPLVKKEVKPWVKKEVKPLAKKLKQEVSLISIASSSLEDIQMLPPPTLHRAAPVSAPLPPNELSADVEEEESISAGKKRRLGMGRGGMGYSNKKFKLPTA